jgi:hypothetical protein
MASCSYPWWDTFDTTIRRARTGTAARSTKAPPSARVRPPHSTGVITPGKALEAFTAKATSM